MNPSGFDQQAAQRLQTAWNAGKRKTPDMSREYPVGLWAAAEKHAKQEKTWQAVGLIGLLVSLTCAAAVSVSPALMILVMLGYVAFFVGVIMASVERTRLWGARTVLVGWAAAQTAQSAMLSHTDITPQQQPMGMGVGMPPMGQPAPMGQPMNQPMPQAPAQQNPPYGLPPTPPNQYGM